MNPYHYPPMKIDELGQKFDRVLNQLRPFRGAIAANEIGNLVRLCPPVQGRAVAVLKRDGGGYVVRTVKDGRILGEHTTMVLENACSGSEF